MIRFILFICLCQCAIATVPITCSLSYVSYDGNYNDNQIPYTTTCGNRIRPVITIGFGGYAYFPYVTAGWGNGGLFDINNFPDKNRILIALISRMSFVNMDTNQLFFPTYSYVSTWDNNNLIGVERSFIRSIISNGDPLTLQFMSDFFFSGTWNVSYTESSYVIPGNGEIYISINDRDTRIQSFSCTLKANKTILAAVSDPIIGQTSNSLTQYNILMFSNPVKKCIGAEPFNGTDIGYPFSDPFTAVDPDSQGYATSWYTTTNTTRVVAGMCGISPMNACDRTGTRAVMGFTYKTTMYSQPAIISSTNCVSGTYDSVTSGWLYFGYGNAFISLDDPTNLRAIRRLPFVLNRTLVNDFYRTNMAISPFTGVGAISSVTHAVTGISDSTTCWNYSTIGLNNNNGVCYNATCDKSLPVGTTITNYYSYIFSATKFIYFDGTQYFTRIIISSLMKSGDSPLIQVFAGRNGAYTMLYRNLIPITPPTLWSGQFDSQSLFVNDQFVLPYVNYFSSSVNLYTYTVPVPITLYNTSLVSIYNVSIATYSEIRFYSTWGEVDPVLSYSVNASAFRLFCEQDAGLTFVGVVGTYLSFTIGNGCQNRSVVLAFVDANAYHTSYRLPQTQSSIVAKQVYTTFITTAIFKGGRILSVLCFNCVNDPATGANDTFWALTCNGTLATSITFRQFSGFNIDFDVVGCTQLQNLLLTVRDGAYHTTLAASIPQSNIQVNLTQDFGLTNAYLLDNTYLILQFNNTNILDSTHFNLTRVTLQCYNRTATLGLPQNSFGYLNQTRITILGNCDNVTAPILTLQNGAVFDSVAITANIQIGPMPIPVIELPPILSSSCIPGTNNSNITLQLKSSGFNISKCAACDGYLPIDGCNRAGTNNISFSFRYFGDGCVNVSLISTQLANTFETQVYPFHACPLINLVKAVYTATLSSTLYLTYDTHPGYSIINSTIIPSFFNFSCDGSLVGPVFAGLDDGNTSLVFYFPSQCYSSLVINSASFAFQTTENLYSNIIYQQYAIIDYAKINFTKCIPGNEESTIYMNVSVPQGTQLLGVTPSCPEYNHTSDGQVFYLIGKIPATCNLEYQFVNNRNFTYNETIPVQLCPIDKSLQFANYTCFPNSTTTSFIHTYLLGKWSYASILQSRGNCSNPTLLRFSAPLIETSIEGTEEDIQFCQITYIILDAANQFVQFSTNYTICPVQVREVTINETQLLLILIAAFVISLLIILYRRCRVSSEEIKETSEEEVELM